MAETHNFNFALIDATLAHVDVMAALHAGCFKVAWSAKEFQELLVLPTVFGFIAQQDFKKSGPVAGFILCRAAGDECEILTLGVLSEYRRRGIADLLLQHFLSTAEEIGVRKIFLEVSENNNPAIALYQGAGFSEVGRRPDYYLEAGRRCAALILAKEIDFEAKTP